MAWRLAGSTWTPDDGEPDEDTPAEHQQEIMRLADEQAAAAPTTLSVEKSERQALALVQQIFGPLRSRYHEAFDLSDEDRATIDRTVEALRGRLIREVAKFLHTTRGDPSPEALQAHIFRRCSKE